MTVVNVPSVILREPIRLWEELRREENLLQKANALLLISIAFFAFYGFILGMSHSPLQALSSAVKLPILYLLTMIVCFPTLHILNLVFGARQSMGQVLVLLLATLAATSVLLLAFAPVAAFFMLTTNNYEFIKLLNVSILGLTAIFGVRFLYKGMHALEDTDDATGALARQRLLKAWIVLYAFVGSQLGWTLRPFFGAPTEPFEFVRQIHGNFYVEIVRAAWRLLGSGGV